MMHLARFDLRPGAVGFEDNINDVNAKAQTDQPASRIPAAAALVCNVSA